MRGLALILLGCMSCEKVRADQVDVRSAHASIEGHVNWRNALPRCTPGKLWVREALPDSGGFDGVRGTLYPGGWICTAMRCDAKCCNPCVSRLKFISRAEVKRKGARGIGLPIRLAGDAHPVNYSSMDCAVDSLKKFPALKVVVSGTVADGPGYDGREGRGRPEKD